MRALLAVLLLLSVPAFADAADAPIRARRRLGISMGVGLRKVTAEGMPVIVTYHARPSLSVAGDVAITEALVSVGLRARWNLLASGLTPFLEGGCELHFGRRLGFVSVDGEGFPYRSTSGLALQAFAGAEWVLPFGLTLRAAAGYSLDTGPRYASEVALPEFDAVSLESRLGSGLLVRGALGWTF